MKKLFFVFLLLFLVTPQVFAKDVLMIDDSDKLYQKKVMDIGYKILNSNKIAKRIVFEIQPDRKIINALAMMQDHSVVLYKGIFRYIDNSDELAYVIAHEIAHNLDFYNGYWTRFHMQYATRYYETRADLNGVDLMVKSGFNPLGSLTFGQKAFGEMILFEGLCTHPRSSKRIALMYVHIKHKYPQYLESKEYKENIYYQNFLLTSQERIKEAEETYQNKSFITVK